MPRPLNRLQEGDRTIQRLFEDEDLLVIIVKFKQISDFLNMATNALLGQASCQ
jgi:hypothetical protein